MFVTILGFILDFFINTEQDSNHKKLTVIVKCCLAGKL